MAARLAALAAAQADPDPLRGGLAARAVVADLRSPDRFAGADEREVSRRAWLLAAGGELDAALGGLQAHAAASGQVRWLAEAARLAATCGWSSEQARLLRAALTLAPTDGGLWGQRLALVALRDDGKAIATALNALAQATSATTQSDPKLLADAWLTRATQRELTQAERDSGNTAAEHCGGPVQLRWLVASNQLAAAWELAQQTVGPDGLAWQARLLLWSGQLEAADTLAARALAEAPDAAEALLVRVVCAFASDGTASAETAVAEPHLSALLALPRTLDNADLHAEALLWQAEWLHRHDRHQEAIRAVERALATARRSLPAAHLLRWVIAPNPPTAASVDAFVPLVRALVADLPGGEAHWAAVAAAVPSALDRLGWNRSGWPTQRADTGWSIADGTSLQRVWLDRSPRQQCRLAQERLYHAPVESVLADLDAVLASCPWSPLPLAFRGELRLWLGDYPLAEADLRLALERWPWTRWAHAGLACAALQRDEVHEALEWLDLGRDRMRGEGPPWRVLRGEAALRGGDPERAVPLLAEATALQPARIAARWLWALALARSGRHDEARRVAVELADGALGLWQTALTIALAGSPTPQLVDVLEAGLGALRGCRASSFSIHAGPDGTGARTLRWQPGGAARLWQTARGQLGGDVRSQA